MTFSETIYRRIRRAADILRAGGLVAFPTETVYGLGADADEESAVRKIFAAKGRPADHPVIVHLRRASDIADWAINIPPAAWQLAESFWPGPLTLILKRSRRAKDVVTGGLDTVGLRVPRHPVAQDLLAHFGGAIAAPSANRFGRVSPTTAQHVRQEFGESLDLILDGGICQVGLESTIVDMSGVAPAILRPGYVTAEQIHSTLGIPLAAATDASPRCAGQLASHYAPQARVEIVAVHDMESRYAALTAAGLRVAVIDSSVSGSIPTASQIPIARDVEVYAQQLYSTLRAVDEAAFEVALVTLPPEAGLGTAIADRLRRAAGPRDDSI
ncbi:MAG TPA: L-threonylcarbamoyladenylate synthase [Pirellulaceae bacterium]|nr:L-threonylcarbamoyladenylate synthase [Pirellulaceae bacterium]